LAAALTMVTLYIDDDVKALAADKLALWFGDHSTGPLG
ncbi:MAG: YkvA family protein, partial [Shewanella sp.]